MPLWQWSTTPANNANAATNIDWQYGMPPSDVSPSARQMMADIAAWYQGGPEWLNYGDVPTYISATSFSVPTNQTGRYTVGRRVRTFNTGGTFYGTVSTAVYSSVTTVTLTMDGTGALDSGLSEVDVGILNPANVSLPALQSLSLVTAGLGTKMLSLSATSSSQGANVYLLGNGNTTPSKSLRAYNGTFQIINDAYNGILMTVDDTGNLTAGGNIAASSDERLKRDWKALAPDFLEKLAAIKSGTFTRIDNGLRQAGVSAQDLMNVLPEAVGGTAILSVAYGQAALVACVELTKEVLRLRALLDHPK